MSVRIHQVQLHSEEHFDGRLPPKFLGFFLADLPVLVEHTISMALRNRSNSPGRRPAWLDRAADIRFVGHGGNGATRLQFEAPTLGTSSPELYEQGELWPTRPNAEDTGFDLLGNVLAEVDANNPDSDNFDPMLLHKLLRFKRFFNGPFREIDFTTRRNPLDHPARISEGTIQTVQSFLGETPASRRTRIVGNLDMIRVSTQTFAVRLDSGEEVRGVLPDGSIEGAKPLLNRRVLIHGKAIYRASGRLLRIDADSISLSEDESSIWSRMPHPGKSALDLSKLHKPQGPRSGMAAIYGKWPGEETDEEVESALKRLS